MRDLVRGLEGMVRFDCLYVSSRKVDRAKVTALLCLEELEEVLEEDVELLLTFRSVLIRDESDRVVVLGTGAGLVI